MAVDKSQKRQCLSLSIYIYMYWVISAYVIMHMIYLCGCDVHCDDVPLKYVVYTYYKRGCGKCAFNNSINTNQKY